MEDCLQHHGIKGQKWGRRRYQNKDGTLTPAGKKRYDNEYMQLKEEKKILTNQKKTAAKIAKLDEMKKANEALRNELNGSQKKVEKSKTETADERPKTIKDLSTDELKARTDRIRAERDYINAQMELSKLQPEKVSAGRKFIESVGKDVIAPAAKNMAKSALEGAAKKALGLDNSKAEAFKKESAKLKREAENWENKVKIDKSKSYFDSKNKKKDSKEKKETEKPKDDDGGWTVEGKGTSRYKKKEGPIFDADFKDVRGSAYADTGRDYVTYLLEDKHRR